MLSNNVVDLLNNQINDYWNINHFSRCSTCLTRLSRPRSTTVANQHICNACLNLDFKASIDWDLKRNEFIILADKYKSMNCEYDMLIPVSGGKDSHWQVSLALDIGLKPLLVTFAPSIPTTLGTHNLNNIGSLGADHFVVHSNLELHKQLVLQGMRLFGSPAIPMHLQIFHTSRALAEKFSIPSVFWGENCALEYGSVDNSLIRLPYSESWFQNFGNTFNTDSKFWASELSLPSIKLSNYNDATSNSNIECDFFGNYFSWDPLKTSSVATRLGFKFPTSPVLGFYSFSDLDDLLLILHHHMKFVKFGVRRAEDNLSIEIRQGRISREEALSKLNDLGEQKLEYDYIQLVSNYLDITIDELCSIIESFLASS